LKKKRSRSLWQEKKENTNSFSSERGEGTYEEGGGGRGGRDKRRDKSNKEKKAMWEGRRKGKREDGEMLS